VEKRILILDADKKQCQELCAVLKKQNYHATPVDSLTHLEKDICENDCQVLVVDLDTVQFDKKLFRNLKKTKPELSILGLSNRPFHPELEEAMSRHIYACINKPVDEDELIFFLKSLR
jgi:DNA-binding NtrC family response regulator